MRTIEYSWYMPSFPTYNVAQAAVVPFLDKDINLVISFATATGKSVLAEGAMAYHLANKDSCRVAYICPFKSLASEKFKAWTEEPQLNKHGVVLWSSDSSEDGHGRERLVVATLESFDLKTRSPYWESWIDSLDLVTVDEAHLIGDESRGGAIEAALMRLTQKNSKVRIILLSATMSNSSDMAKWVKLLNGKPTKCITSSWRPTEVKMEYHVVGGYSEKVDKAMELAENASGRKTLVFVHSKVTGSELVKRLRQRSVRSVFHNASLSGAKRRKIETVFNDPTSGLNIVIATSTLSTGVNLA